MNSPDYRMAIVDLRIPFWRLVTFFVKATLAMIPAAIILTLIFSLLGAAVWALFQSNFPELQKLIEMMMRRSTI